MALKKYSPFATSLSVLCLFIMVVEAKIERAISYSHENILNRRSFV